MTSYGISNLHSAPPSISKRPNATTIFPTTCQVAISNEVLARLQQTIFRIIPWMDRLAKPPHRLKPTEG